VNAGDNKIGYRQCRIKSSKCSNCYGPRGFRGPWVICFKFVFRI